MSTIDLITSAFASFGQSAIRSNSISTKAVMSISYQIGKRVHLSPLRQFQLDAAVVAEGFVAGAGIDRLELAKTGGDQALRRDALADQILHHRDGARRRQVPVRLERRGHAELSCVGVAVDAQHPVDLGWNLLFQIEQRASKLIELGAAFGP